MEQHGGQVVKTLGFSARKPAVRVRDPSASQRAELPSSPQLLPTYTSKNMQMQLNK